MSHDDRFKPPGAAVADIQVDPGDLRAAVITLAVAGLLQLGWVAMRVSGYLELVDVGALRPIGLLFAVGGLACLYLGVGRLVLRSQVGVRLFVVASVLLSACVASWWVPRPLDVVMPFLFGIVLAVAGWRIAHRRRGAGLAAESP